MRELPPDTPDLLTPGEVAKLFRVTPETVWRWGKTARGGSVRTPGGTRRYRKADVQAALNEGYTPGRTGQ